MTPAQYLFHAWRSDLPAPCRLVLARLAFAAVDSMGQLWPVVAEARDLATDTGLSVEVVRQALAQLAREGWVVRMSRLRGGASVLDLRVPEDDDDNEGRR